LQGIETQATYDPSSQQFVIKTPQNEASKFWIGGAGQHGKICTVFAQLTVGDKWQGPHVFVVRLRDDTGAVARGVQLLLVTYISLRCGLATSIARWCSTEEMEQHGLVFFSQVT
jgi:alkylation response protein AidB-like acyl-CoA dehydrogenase